MTAPPPPGPSAPHCFPGPERAASWAPPCWCHRGRTEVIGSEVQLCHQDGMDEKPQAGAQMAKQTLRRGALRPRWKAATPTGCPPVGPEWRAQGLWSSFFTAAAAGALTPGLLGGAREHSAVSGRAGPVWDPQNGEDSSAGWRAVLGTSHIPFRDGRVGEKGVCGPSGREADRWL